MAIQAAERIGPAKHVSERLDTGSIDTVYRDLYLPHARTLMAGVLSLDRVLTRFAVVRRERMAAW
jgi:hypothetical protein